LSFVLFVLALYLTKWAFHRQPSVLTLACFCEEIPVKPRVEHAMKKVIYKILLPKTHSSNSSKHKGW